jgi:predicted P-loop ATPase
MLLTGPQGWGKSSVWREWANWPGQTELYSDTRFNIKDKDCYLQLYSALICEDAEMAGSSNADQETRKAFITSAVDRFRPPFGRKMRTYRRHTVITMTSNEQDVLRDRTGSRRYWVVPCSGESAGLRWLGKYRDQMLAEAYEEYQKGQQWWLTPDESKMQRKANGVFQYHDWFSQCALTAWDANGAGKRNRFTVAEFAAAIDQNLSVQRFGLSLSSALHAAGFTRYRSGGATYYYKTGDSTGSATGLLAIRGLTRSSHEQQAGL